MPGDWVWICGFPLGCDTPRLAHGMVSGYAALSPNSLPVTCPVIQAPVNQGNSGGPICDAEGKLVGVIWAINNRFRPGIPRPKSPAARSAIEWVEKALIPIDGYGFALDPADLQTMVESLAEVRSLGKFVEKFPPRSVEFSGSDFVELQRQAVLQNSSRPPGSSCIGIFNYSPHGELLLGWHGQTQVKLEAPKSWLYLCANFFGQGGHFYLRGHDIVHYYKGRGYSRGVWTPRVRLELYSS